MRALTAAQQGAWDSGSHAAQLRVSVKDSGGAFRDLTTYPGYNAVKSVTLSERIEDPHATVDVTLIRELERFSLSPLMGASALNHGFDPLAAVNPLVALAREVKVEAAFTAMDRAPAAGDWFEIFRGLIDSWDAKGMTFAARSLGGRLAQQFIKKERVYSFAEVGGVAVALRIYEPGTVYALNEYVLPATRGADDSGYGKFYKVTTAGTTGATEPTWPGAGTVGSGTVVFTYQGATTTAGTPVEEVMQNILDGNIGTGDSAVALYTPVSPGWMIRQFIQRRETTLDAVRKLAEQIGWDVRYKWRAAASQFELTFYEPNRSSPTVAFAFDADDYEEVERLAADISKIRNVWRVIYSDAADLWPDGTAKRKVVEVSDATSIAKYKESIAEISEEDASLIDSSAEATDMANAALSDTAEPTAEMSIRLTRAFPWVELNDYFSFQPDGRLFDAGQSLAVTGFDHRWEGGRLRTSLEVRGKPTIGATVHIEKAVHKSKPDRQPHQLVTFEGAETPTVFTYPIVGGGRIFLDYLPDKRAQHPEFEFHISDTAGFTPSAATLETVSKDLTLEVGDLNPGTTYYVRVVQRARNSERVLRGQPSAPVSFVAGRAAAGHISSEPDLTRLPLNGGFETSTDGVAADHWTAIGVDTVWGGGWNLLTGTGGVSGSNYIELSTTMGDAAELRSATMQVEDGTGVGLAQPPVYFFEWLYKPVSGTGNHYVDIQWLNGAGALISTDTTENDNTTTGWTKQTKAYAPPSGAKYARVHVRKKTAADAFTVQFDYFRLRKAEPSSQLLFGSSTLPVAGSTDYMKPGAPYAAAGATELKVPAPFDGVLHRVRGYANGGGGGALHTFTVRVNGVDAGITFTIGSTGGGWPAAGSDDTNFVLVSAGDLVSLKCVTTIAGGPFIAATDVIVSLTIER